jgi:uncharacterized membrane protein YfcA
MTWSTVVLIIGIGAVVGFLGGLFGKGGSAIATPLLAAVGLPPIVAVASPLPAIVPGTLVAASAYWRDRLFDRRVVVWSVAVGVPATLLGAYLTRWIGGEPLVVVTEVIVAALGLRFVLHPGDPHEVAGDEPMSRARMAAVAGTVGLVSGLLANGGGFLLAPLYVLVLHLHIKQAFASSLAVASVLAIPGTIVHAALGHIDWTVVGLFGVSAIPLSYMGARVAIRTHAPRLERLYGVALLLLGVITLALTL